LPTSTLEPLIEQVAVAPSRCVPEPAERLLGALLLAAASPLIAVSAVAASALSGRSPFVGHLRVGQGGKTFWMLKLRTMWEGRSSRGHGWVERIVAEPSGDGKDPADPRVTSRFAAFCRRHSIDELPQLWHVVRGEMSLVGPRPLTRTELVRYYGRHVAELLSVKPGLTGVWQVRGRSAVNFPRRVTMDLELVRTLSPKLYLSLLLRTLPALIHGKGAW
jgi:lipopolysaccharide/colanic/teichoic acid biosynthesis glycosyltransferase